MLVSRRRRALGLIGWVLAAAVLWLLVRRVGWPDLALSWRVDSRFVGYLFVMACFSLLGDAWASRIALRSLGIQLPFRDLALARGSSYLAGAAHYAAGQGFLAWLLWRKGIDKTRAAAAVTFLMATTALATAALALVGTACGPPELRRGPYLPLAGACVTVIAAYFPLVVACRRSHRMWRIPLLREALAPRARDHVVAATARATHIAAVATLAYGALLVWGLTLSPRAGLATQPVLLLTASIPITPSGLGTVQAIQVDVFSPYLEPELPHSAESRILACALAGHVVGAASQLLLAFICLALQRRRALAPEKPV